MEISNLIEDLLEEIFCKLPVTSVRAIRLTCKKWNTISKRHNFAEKHINKAKSAAASARELSLIMVTDHKFFLMELHNINGIPYINRKAEVVLNLEKEICSVFHCNGLLLCSSSSSMTKDEKLVVWNPYWGETRWIEPGYSYKEFDIYTLGYEVMKNNTRSFKMLKIYQTYVDKYENYRFPGFEIYDFKYNSWRSIEITEQYYWSMELFIGGVSLKGNTYWYGRVYIKGVSVDYLICFDFTSERFGPRLSFPPCSGKAYNVVLSSVGEEKLVVLVARQGTLEMEIWVTSEIEPTLVSWSKLFLTVKMREFYYCGFQSFFIEEENKVAVFVGKDKDKRRNMAYIFGVGGYLREVDLGESTHRLCLIFPYVPSSVHIR